MRTINEGLWVSEMFRTLSSRIERVSKMPLRVVARKILARPGRAFRKILWRHYYTTKELRTFESNSAISSVPSENPTVSNLLDAETLRLLNHEFNLLGIEGNVWNRSPNNVMDPCEVQQACHQNVTKHLRSMISGTYQCIDWHRDPRSGFGWPMLFGPDLTKLKISGVDIKNPWEVGRLQHLPYLALKALHNPDQEKILNREIINTVIDFIAHNPPGMGVQWACAMDVAIRAVNLSLTWQILCNPQSTNHVNPIFFDKTKQYPFRKLLVDSIRAHGKFLWNHLEYNDGHRGNHYLADLCGLICCAIHAGDDPECMKWLRFGAHAFVHEVLHQFYSDGMNYESSTSYHRLSSEIAAIGTSLLLGLSQEKRDRISADDPFDFPPEVPKFAPVMFQREQNLFFPDEYVDRLRSIYRTTLAMTDMQNLSVLIGDNDSGRIVKLDDWKIEDRDFTGVISMLAGLFDKKPIGRPCNEHSFQIISVLSGNNFVSPSGFNDQTHSAIGYPPPIKHQLPLLSYSSEETIYSDKTLNLNGKWTFIENARLLFYSSNNLFLSFNLMGVGRDGHGGHAHNDCLSVTLRIDNQDIWYDAGTFTYTASIEERNRYRSATAHCVPIVTGDEEFRRWELGPAGLFTLNEEVSFKLVHLTKEKAIGEITFRNIIIRREVSVLSDRVNVKDCCNRPFRQNWNRGELYSPGYGQRKLN